MKPFYIVVAVSNEAVLIGSHVHRLVEAFPSGSGFEAEMSLGVLRKRFTTSGESRMFGRVEFPFPRRGSAVMSECCREK